MAPRPNTDRPTVAVPGHRTPDAAPVSDPPGYGADMIPSAWPAVREIPPRTWEPPAGTRVISADDHVIEPTDLWADRVATKDRDRAPRIWRDADGVAHVEVDGRSFDVPGLNPHLVEGRAGFLDLELRLADMDAEGIDAAVLFPQKALAIMSMADKDFLFDCCDVYNEWLAQWCAQAPDRLHGVAILPVHYAPEKTAAFLDKVKALGFKAIELPSSPRGVFYNGSAMEPMWDAIEASGLPLSFHIGEFPNWKGKGALGTFLTNSFQPFRPLWALLTFSGVLERHPGMQVVFTEGGASWVAQALADADMVYRNFGTELVPKLAEPPSASWHRQCHATFIDEPIALRLIDDIGRDKLLWSVDYPHPESSVGGSVEIMRSIFDTVGIETAQALVGGNAARLWGL